MWFNPSELSIKAITPPATFATSATLEVESSKVARVAAPIIILLSFAENANTSKVIISMGVVLVIALLAALMAYGLNQHINAHSLTRLLSG